MYQSGTEERGTVRQVKKGIKNVQNQSGFARKIRRIGKKETGAAVY